MGKGEVKDRYQAVAVSHNINPGDPDNNKAPQIEVEMRGLDHQAGKQFWLYLSLKEGQAQEISAKTLRTLGWTCNDITVLEGLGSVKVDVVEKEEVYQGKKKPRYDIWPTRGPRASLRDEDQQNFAARFKALAASVKPIEVTESNAAPETLPEPIQRNGAGTSTPDAGADPSSMYD